MSKTNLSDSTESTGSIETTAMIPVKKLTVRAVTPSIANQSFFFFGIGIFYGYLDVTIISEQIKEENEIVEFGIDPGLLQLLIDCYKKNEIPDVLKGHLSLTAYQYIVYCELKGKNILGWLSEVPAPFDNIFSFPKDAFCIDAIQQLTNQRCLIFNLFKNTDVKIMEDHFQIIITGEIEKIKNEFLPVQILNLHSFKLVELMEFVGRIIRDLSSLERKEVSLIKKMFAFCSFDERHVMADVITEQKSFFSETFHCSERKISAMVEELTCKDVNFNREGNNRLDLIFIQFQVNGILPAVVLSIGHYDKWMVSTIHNFIKKY